MFVCASQYKRREENLLLLNAFSSIWLVFVSTLTVADLTPNKSLLNFLIVCTAKWNYSTCTGDLYPKINQQGREAEYLAAFSASFSKVSNCTSTARICSHIVRTDKFTSLLIVVSMFQWFGLQKDHITLFQHLRRILISKYNKNCLSPFF